MICRSAATPWWTSSPCHPIQTCERYHRLPKTLVQAVLRRDLGRVCKSNRAVKVRTPSSVRRKAWHKPIKGSQAKNCGSGRRSSNGNKIESGCDMSLSMETYTAKQGTRSKVRITTNTENTVPITKTISHGGSVHTKCGSVYETFN